MRVHLVRLALLWAAAAPAGAADWAALAPYQETITREAFEDRLNGRYSRDGMHLYYFAYRPGGLDAYADSARTNDPVFTLRFAAEGPTARAARPPFKTLEDLAALHNPADQPMRGIRIALDPGHIGGAWARMEERVLFADPEAWPVQEGAMNLLVARKLRARLEAAGATVLMTRDALEPVTAERPGVFAEDAERETGPDLRFPELPDLLREADRADRVRKRQELLFYRRAEIRARAERVNRVLKPDLALCLHFNATARQNGEELHDENALVLFLHGNYLPGELADPEQRQRLLFKLLSGAFDLEYAAGAAVAASLAKATGLPPVRYAEGGAALGTDHPYLYLRNLAANRLFDCPVIFLEPYYMNNRAVYHRIQAGDYDGERVIDGRPCRSIFREYADAVADGLLDFYRGHACAEPSPAMPAAPSRVGVPEATPYEE